MAFGDIVQSKQGGIGTPYPSTFGLTFDTGATAGNLLIAAHFTGASNSTAPSGFAEAVALTDGGNGDQGAIYYKIAAGGETTITAGSNGNDEHALVTLEIEGPFEATPLDVTASAGPSDTASRDTGTTATTAQADEVAVAAVTYRMTGPNVSAWSNSFTERGDVGSSEAKGVACATKVLTATGTQTTTATFGSSAVSVGGIATFKKSAGGGGGGFQAAWARNSNVLIGVQ